MNRTTTSGGLLSASALLVASSASAAPSRHQVVVACEVETVEHINCGGGLRAPDEPAPDCSKGDVERVIAKRSERIKLPSTDFVIRDGKIDLAAGHHADTLMAHDGMIYFSPVLSLYTDAAGFSVERGPCSIVSGRQYIRRQKASIQ